MLSPALTYYDDGGDDHDHHLNCRSHDDDYDGDENDDDDHDHHLDCSQDDDDDDGDDDDHHRQHHHQH